MIVLLIMTLSSSSWAQMNEEVVEVTAAASPTPSVTPMPTIDPRASAKDSILNDPSAQPTLKLPRVIPQKELALKGVGELIAGGLFINLFEMIFPRYSRILKNHPESFDLLEIHRNRYEPAIENGPTLVNADFEFDGISDKKFGYCWGFATLLRNFLTLAFYDPRQPRFEDPEDYTWYIRQIAKGKPTIIPGFADLREMSSVPEIELLLKLEAMKQWRKKAIRLSSIGLYLKTAKAMDHDSAMSLVDDLEARLARGELPKIVFSSKVAAGKLVKLSKYIHVVLVNGIERTETGARIRIWDVNFFAETLIKSPKYIEVNGDGTLVYEPWFEPGVEYEADSKYISRISYAPENDREVVKFIRRLGKFCNQPENASWCEK